jgi:hypothetical protein
MRLRLVFTFNSAFLLGVLLAATALRAEVSISSERATLSSNNPLLTTESEVLLWIRDFKKEMIQGYMLNLKSRFAKFSQAFGSRASDDARNKLTYRVDVRPLEKLPGVYVALFWDPISMTKSLLRADLYAHGGSGIKRGHIATGNEVFYQESLCACRGLNLYGPDLFDFFSLKTESLQEESVFYSRILAPLFKKFPRGKGLTLIAVSLRTFSLDTLGHEILHAHWDQFENFRKIVKRFWRADVKPADKKSIIDSLGFIYGKTELDVLLNEFQAYLLQPRVPAGQSDFLVEFRPKYESALANQLSTAGLLPDLSQSSCRGHLVQLAH